jgi:hypothetical protein
MHNSDDGSNSKQSSEMNKILSAVVDVKGDWGMVKGVLARDGCKQVSKTSIQENSRRDEQYKGYKNILGEHSIQFLTLPPIQQSAHLFLLSNSQPICWTRPTNELCSVELFLVF